MRGRWRDVTPAEHNKKFYIVCFVIIWAVQMAAAFYFCTQKQGFHEDEYYTYYSTARTSGFYVENGQWMDRETYRNEFVVLPGQQFRYGLVKQVQSWDVHPPVYYWVFHTAASMVPGVFSKWIGLSVNLLFHGINLILLTYLAYLVNGRKIKGALLVTLFYGLTPAAVSGVVFIRMYEMLTMWVLLCAVLHVKAVEARQEKVRQGKNAGETKWGKDGFCELTVPTVSWKGFLVPLALVTYLGFLTQYYYFIFLFFMGAVFCVYLLWCDRRLRNCLYYGSSQIIALVLAYVTYPSCLGQMFRGQRGAQATENFLDLSNTLERIKFFYDLLDEYVFGKLLTWFLLAAVILAVTAYSMAGRNRQYRKPDAVWCLLAAAVMGYFLTVSKTALLLGDTSNRYQLPVYGMIVLLLFAGISKIKMPGYLGVAAAVVCLIVDISGLVGGKVVFLYSEDRWQVEFAREQAAADTPVVYVYQPGAEWCIWDVTNELLEYPAVYFVAADSGNLIEDDRIAEAENLVVYLADGVDADAQLNRILGSAANLTGYKELEFEEKYCDIYYIR